MYPYIYIYIFIYTYIYILFISCRAQGERILRSGENGYHDNALLGLSHPVSGKSLDSLQLETTIDTTIVDSVVTGHVLDCTNRVQLIGSTFDE
jgi:hypothetical protein